VTARTNSVLDTKVFKDCFEDSICFMSFNISESYNIVHVEG